tara:strand:+ start:279 stop:650 length:372 start_codon:yes stop_codon:yes gene_type:complete
MDVLIHPSTPLSNTHGSPTSTPNKSNICVSFSTQNEIAHSVGFFTHLIPLDPNRHIRKAKQTTHIKKRENKMREAHINHLQKLSEYNIKMNSKTKKSPINKIKKNPRWNKLIKSVLKNTKKLK